MSSTTIFIVKNENKKDVNGALRDIGALAVHVKFLLRIKLLLHLAVE